MRLFAGIRPDREFRNALSLLQERLRSAGVTGRYYDPADLHMTLAFIGEWPDDVTPVLPPVETPFSITLSRPGVFPEARVLWAGTEPSEELERLAEQVRRNLERAGVPFDPKPFRPHITLIRKPAVPAGVNLSGTGVPQASMTVDAVCLYRSGPDVNGTRYTVIGSTMKGYEEPS